MKTLHKFLAMFLFTHKYAREKEIKSTSFLIHVSIKAQKSVAEKYTVHFIAERKANIFFRIVYA